LWPEVAAAFWGTWVNLTLGFRGEAEAKDELNWLEGLKMTTILLLPRSRYTYIAFIYQMIAVNYIWKHSVFAYCKREHYCFNRFCFEMARQITLSTELSWQPKLARYFKTEPTVIVPFSFGISENTVFSNVIDSYHLVDERYISICVEWKSNSVCGSAQLYILDPLLHIEAWFYTTMLLQIRAIYDFLFIVYAENKANWFIL
jgi:hypothetical protein